MKVDNFYEETTPMMTPRYFRRFYRMYSETMENLIDYLRDNPGLQKQSAKSLSLEKRIHMCTCYLGAKTPSLQCVPMFQTEF